MLPAKPWKADAIIRLVLSIIVCVYAGSLLVSVLHYAGAGGKLSPALFFPLAALALGCLAAALVVIGKPWNPDRFARRLVILLACAYGGLFLGAWLQQWVGEDPAEVSIQRMVFAALSFQGAGLLLIGRFLREQQCTWAEGFGFRNQSLRALLIGFLAALIFLPLAWGLQQAAALLMTHFPRLGLEPKEQLPIQALRDTMSWGVRIALGSIAVLLAPVAEEMLFRGILYPAIKQLGFPRLALWGTSLLFAAIHFNLVTLVPLTALALLLIALYERTGNLLAPIMAHVLFNALNFATLLWQQLAGP